LRVAFRVLETASTACAATLARWFPDLRGSLRAPEPVKIPKSGKLTCDRIVSASVRRKFFADHTLRDVQDMSDSDSMAYCLIDQEGSAFSIEVDCAVSFSWWSRGGSNPRPLECDY